MDANFFISHLRLPFVALAKKGSFAVGSTSAFSAISGLKSNFGVQRSRARRVLSRRNFSRFDKPVDWLRALSLSKRLRVPSIVEGLKALSQSMGEGGSGSRAKSAHKKDNKADQQNQAKPAAADGRTANIKTTAAEQEKKNNDHKEYIHDGKIALCGNHDYGVFPHSKPKQPDAMIHHGDTEGTENRSQNH